MKFSHIVYYLIKILLNKTNFVMTSYFHNGTLARYTGSGFHLHIKIGNYVKHLSITF